MTNSIQLEEQTSKMAKRLKVLTKIINKKDA